MVKDKLMAITMKISILFFMVFLFNVTSVCAADDEVYTIDNFRFKYITDDTIEIVGINTKDGNNKNVNIPSKIYHNNKYVYIVQIGDRAFENSDINSIVISEGVTSIGKSAFSSCRYLTSVTLPKGLINLGEYAFAHCHTLTNISFPEGLTSIGDEAFWDSRLTSIYIPASVKKIGDYAFNDGISSIRVNANNKVYDSRNNCNALIESKNNKLIQGSNKTIIPNSIKIIGINAFRNCKFTNITIPEGVTSIEKGAFCGCKGLTNITIPEGVTRIGADAFLNCDNLKTVTLSKTIECIARSAFDIFIYSYYEYNPNISFKVVKGTNSEIWVIANGYPYEYYTPYKTDTKPSSVLNISETYTFNKKTGEATVREVKLYTKSNYIVPDTVKDDKGIVYKVTTIEANAFKNNKKLKTVTIGSNVKIIDKNAFYGCTNLKKVTIKSKVLSKIGKRAFKGTYKKIKFICPKKKLKKYKKMIKKSSAPKKALYKKI